MPRTLLAALAASFVVSTTLLAQTVDPIGRVHPNAQPLTSVAAIAVPAIDRATISQEDVLRRHNGQPNRYAMPFPTDVDVTASGTWEQLDGTWSLCRLRIQAPNSSHINLGFDQFFMPGNARMMVYSSDYTTVVRPFDAADHSPTGQLWTPVTWGEEATIEIYVPTAARPQVVLNLTQVGSGYRFFGAGGDALGYDVAGACNVDVACAAAAPWVNEIPCVAAISSGGSIFCTGAMINNTANDQRNYFLTANHCGVTSGVAPSLVCYWNYKNATCGAGPYSLSQFNTGATFRSTSTTSDFTLVELNAAPNPAWGVTYGGWNRSTGDFASAVCIHHPQGDVKKISWENDPTATTSYGGTATPGNGSHVRIIDWDTGTTEPGSSGSPLFNPNHQIIGQLHGGSAACGNNLSDYFGRLSVSWTGGGTAATRLSNWLDPLNTGATSVNTLVPGGGGTIAQATPYGIGCYTSWGAYAQTFGATAFDLGGTASVTNTVNHAPIANGYTVQAGANTWFTPVAANLGLTDDSVSAALTLPFTFNFPGGSTTQIRICSNGYIWLNGTSTTADYQPAVATLIAGPARLCPLWMDLNPAGGGTVHYDVDPSNTAVYVTWNGVVAFGTTTANTVQCVLRNTGAVEYRYRAIGSTTATSLVGRARGTSATPPNTDISAAMPFAVTVDAAGLSFTPANRPILGTTQTINLTNVPTPASSIGIVIVAFSQVNPGVDLTSIGAPGCFLYAPLTVTQTLFPLSTSTAWNLAIPNTPSLATSHVYVQGAALIPPGTNAFGALTSNGVDLLLGTL